MEEPLIDLKPAMERHPATRALSGFARPVERLLGLDQINAVYEKAGEWWEQEGSWYKACLRALGVSWEVSTEDLDRFPQTGPVVVVSNHPFGAIDGLILSAILEEVRPDFRLFGNFMLDRIVPMRPHLITVDPFEGGKGSRRNTKGIRTALQWLKEGGVLGVFPSGEVSHYHFRQRAVRDPKWNQHAVSLAWRAGASVVPLYVKGRNSLLFQSLGKVHPNFRTMMLAREATNKQGRNVPVLIGRPITHAQLDRLSNDAERTRFVRLRTEILGNRMPLRDAQLALIPSRQAPDPQPVIDPVPSGAIVSELEALPEESELLSYKQFTVYLAAADQIPATLREIGRLREISFRAEGEGSGKDCDLDEFDEHYLHLFLYDRVAQQVAGSYRVGMTDEILPKHGKKGLYTHTLFKLSDRFLEELNPALEMGRSFIAPDYQRVHQTLNLLWRGIALILVRNPRYSLLFGPVSISNTYSQASKALITRYLRDGEDEDLLRLAASVRPRRPFRMRRQIRGLEGDEVSHLLNGVENVNALISEIEADRKGIPILLKHYLKMHTTLLSFNVDRKFSNCLDGLIMTDLGRTDTRFLRKFFDHEALDQLQKGWKSHRSS